MKNQALGVTFVVLALAIGILAGFILGQNLEFDSQSAVGSYKTDSWNGKSASLILKKDGTCKYPTGTSGTWTQEKNIISIVLHGTDIHTAEVVENGILLHGHFFEKVN